MAPTQNSRRSRQPDEASPLLPKGERVTPYHGKGHEDATDGGNDNDATSAERGVSQQNNIDDPASIQNKSSLEEAAKRLKAIYPILVLGPFLTGIDYSFTFSSSGKIGSDLGGLSKSSWITTSYFLTFAAFQPLYGKLSDIFGRKPCYLFGHFAFGLGSLLCGLSRTIDELIAARLIQGLGASGILGILSILLTDTVPVKNRGPWQAVTMFASAAGSAIGAPVGGLMADTIGWRWSFLGQAPLTLAVLLVIAAALKPPPIEQMPWKQRLGRIDFLGSFLFLVAVGCLIFGLDRGGNVGWTSKWTYLPLCICIPFFALFAVVEARFAHEPIAPARVVLGPSNNAVYLCQLFNYAAWFGMLFYVPRYLQAVRGFSAAKSGAFLLPVMICNVAFALLSGYRIKRTGKYWVMALSAQAISVLGAALVLLSEIFLPNPTVGMCIGLSLYGLCNGVIVNVSLVALIANSQKRDLAISNACWYLFRSLGSTMGISVASAVTNQVLRTGLEASLGNGREADKIARHVRDNLGYIDTLGPETKKIVIDCYALSTRAALIFVCMMAVCAVMSAWFIIEKPLSDKLPGADTSGNEDETTS